MFNHKCLTHRFFISEVWIIRRRKDTTSWYFLQFNWLKFLVALLAVVSSCLLLLFLSYPVHEKVFIFVHEKVFFRDDFGNFIIFNCILSQLANWYLPGWTACRDWNSPTNATHKVGLTTTNNRHSKLVLKETKKNKQILPQMLLTRLNSPQQTTDIQSWS